MIAVGCDHAGYELKREVISHLTEKGYEIMDLGCNGESCDYPLIANEVADNILNKKCDKGILICGTGIGMSIKYMAYVQHYAQIIFQLNIQDFIMTQMLCV